MLIRFTVVVVVNFLLILKKIVKMKKYLLFLLVPLYALACTKSDTISHSMLEKVANDQMYSKLEMHITETTNGIMMGKYNFKKIKQVSNQPVNTFKESCTYDLGEYANDQTVTDYFSLLCNKMKVLKSLKEKYPFLNDRDANHFEDIHKIYKKNHPDNLDQDKIRDLIINRKNNK
jgi:hypothetical protein